MKKMIVLLFACVYVITLTSCGENGEKVPAEGSLRETASMEEISNDSTDVVGRETLVMTEDTTGGGDIGDTAGDPATITPTLTPPTTEMSHTHNYSEATCTSPAKCSCGATVGDKLERNYMDGICTYCQKAGGEIKITIDNWEKYFEVYEWVDWNLNAFGDPTEFFGIRCSFNIKSEYANKCSANIACEYLINQSHCDITYDVQNKTCKIVDRHDYFDEHLSTLSGGEYESYISFSLGDQGETTGTCTIAKYNFIKMTRIEGAITFY